MADFTNLTASVEALKAEVADIGVRMSQSSSGDQAAVDAATTAVNEQVAALKAMAAPPAP